MTSKPKKSISITEIKWARKTAVIFYKMAQISESASYCFVFLKQAIWVIRPK